MNRLSDLPLELRIEIFNNCSYVSRLSLYQYILQYDGVIDRYLNIMKKQLNKILSIDDIREIFEFDNDKLLKIILDIIPEEVYLDRYIEINQRELLLLAVKHNSLKILKFLCESPFIKNSYINPYRNPFIPPFQQSVICYEAILNNNLECLNYIRSRDFQWNSNIFLAAAKNNNFELFKYFHSNNLDIKEELQQDINLTLFNNESILLKDKNMANTCHIWKHIDKMYSCVARCGNVEFLEYLHNIKPITNGKHLSSAIKDGHFNVIEWGMKKLIPMTDKHCRRDASSGNLKLLIWLRQNGCPWDHRTAISSCKSGNIELFEYIISQFISNNIMIHFGPQYITKASKGNQLEMIKYLHNRGYTGTETALYYACIHDNFEMFKYGINNDFYKMDSLLKNSLLDIIISKKLINYLKYLIEHKYPILECLSKICCQYGNLDIIRELDLICTSKDIEIAASFKQYYIVAKLVESGIQLTDITIDIIINHNNFKMFQWCLDHGYLITRSNIITAMNNDLLEYFKIMIHLFEHGDEHILVSKNSFCILKYLYQNKMISFDLNLYSSTKDSDMIKWLKSINYPQVRHVETGTVMTILSKGIELYLSHNQIRK